MTKTQRWVFGVALVAACLALALGVAVMFGWFFGNRTLIQVLPAFVPMQFNTALCLSLAALAALLAVLKQWKWVAAVAAFLSGLIAFITLCEYVFVIDLPIDELFLKHYVTTKTKHPGRMSPNTGLCYVFSSVGFLFLLLGTKKYRSSVSSTLAGLVLALAFTSLFGYATSISVAYAWGNVTGMAVHTSTGFVLLSLALYFTSWNFDRHGRPLAWVTFPFGLCILVLALGILNVVEVLHEQANTLSELAVATEIIIIPLFLLCAFIGVYFFHKAIAASQQVEEEKQKALDAEEAKSRLLSFVAHELRNPVGCILGYAELKETNQEILESIHSVARHLQLTIEDLLDLARIESGKLSLQCDQLTFADWFRDLRAIIDQFAKSHSVNVVYEVNQPLEKIYVDQQKMKQIVLNLTFNAIRYSPNDGEVKISIALEEDQRHMLIRVEDHGPGISEKVKEHLFEPFTEGAAETGLGLCICREFAELLQGSLWVESEEGKGLTVYCRLLICC